MKILSFQPGSLYQNGGCGRVLRRLYAGQEDNITSLYVSYTGKNYTTGLISEKFVSTFPLNKTWARWKLRNLFTYLQDEVFKSKTTSKLRQVASQTFFDVLHVVNHGPYCTSLCTVDLLLNRKLWVSFHDHYSLCSTFDECSILWNTANRRMVISKELGEEYSKLFGKKEYEIITDGVAESEISVPKQDITADVTTVYFGGLLHFEYLPLFKVLADALDLISRKKTKIKLILRGSQKIDFLENRSFEVEYKTDFVSDAEIKAELDKVDILYLPIKFSHPEFYLYSLSTKMIGYLGARGAILYHGPIDSAAVNLLKKTHSASYCTTLNVDDMLSTIDNTLKKGSTYSANAKELAKSMFLLQNIQHRFWQAE